LESIDGEKEVPEIERTLYDELTPVNIGKLDECKAEDASSLWRKSGGKPKTDDELKRYTLQQPGWDLMRWKCQATKASRH